MSTYQRLPIVSKRYGPLYPQYESSSEGDSENDNFSSDLIPSGPITLRQPTDESVTDSDEAYTSDEAATDDGEEFPTNRQARERRQAEARQRLNNTKQFIRYCIDGSKFQSEVLFVVLCKLLSTLFRYLYDLAQQLKIFALNVFNGLLQLIFIELFLLTLEAFSRLVQIALRSIKDFLQFFIWLISNILYGLLQIIRQDGEFGLTVVVFVLSVIVALSPFAMIGGSMLFGYKAIITYDCNRSGGKQSWVSSTGVCDHSTVNATLATENQQLQELLATSDMIIGENQQPVYERSFNHDAFRDLRDAVVELEWFMKEHKKNLSDPEAIDEIVRSMHKNVVFLGKSSEWFKSEYQMRADEMMVYLTSVIEGTRNTRAESSFERFFSEMLYALIPSAFSPTHTARQVKNYIRVAKHFQNQTEALTPFDDPGVYSETIRAIRSGLDLIYNQVAARPEQFKLPCSMNEDPFQEAVCYKSGKSTLLKLRRAIPLALKSAEAWEKAGRHHLFILRGFGRLHRQLSSLLEDSTSRSKSTGMARIVDPELVKDTWERYAGTHEVDPMSARAILCQFIVEVGEMEQKKPYGASKMTLKPDGSYEPQPRKEKEAKLILVGTIDWDSDIFED